MKSISIAILFLTTTAFACEVPLKLQEKFTEKGFEVKEYALNSKRLFMIDRRDECCDLGATVYDSKGEIFCGFIGIAGAWEAKCIGFDQNAEYIKTISATNNGT